MSSLGERLHRELGPRRSRIDDRLEMLHRVLGVDNGDRSLEVLMLGFCDADHYAVDVSWFEDGGTYEAEMRGLHEHAIEHRQFRAPTLALAVERAWVYYGAPIGCLECKGEGEFVYWDEQIPDGADNVREHHDGRRSLTIDCAGCFESQGYVFTTDRAAT